MSLRHPCLTYHPPKNHMVKKTTGTSMECFRTLKQERNFHLLKGSLKTNTYTDAARNQNIINLKAYPPEQRSWYSVQRIAASFAGSQPQSDSSADAGTQGRRKSGLQGQNQCCEMVYHRVIRRQFHMCFYVQLATNLQPNQQSMF